MASSEAALLRWRLVLGAAPAGDSADGLWAEAEREEKRVAARALGVGVELHVLDLPVEELWARIERRNRDGSPGSVPITRAQLDAYLPWWHAPSEEERSRYDAPPGS